MNKTYGSIEHFYIERGGQRSGEVDFGVWWYNSAREPHRVSWVEQTGDIYAINQRDRGTVELLGTTAPCTHGWHTLSDRSLSECEGRNQIEALLDGWADKCGEPDSLAWVRERAAGVKAR